jgi:hypothetical protein
MKTWIKDLKSHFNEEKRSHYLSSNRTDACGVDIAEIVNNIGNILQDNRNANLTASLA